MAELVVLSPVAKAATAKAQNAAARLPDLSGKRIGLYWNNKIGGDILLEQTGELLRQKYSGIKLKNFSGSLGAGGMKKLAPEDTDLLAKECDAIVGATSD